MKSDEEFHFHLTPHGWIAGSTKIDVQGWRKLPEPEDRIITAVFKEFSAYGDLSVDLSVDVIELADRDTISGALRSFGTDPCSNANSYEGWPQFVSKYTE